jgi:hypothetical protein
MERESQAVAVAEMDTPVEVMVPSLEIQETFLSIIDLLSNHDVVTVLEFLSPTNKYAGPGRESYLAKQLEVFRSQAHLVEIDLLRTGPHALMIPESVSRGLNTYAYLACVNRAGGRRERFQLYPCGLRERLFRIRIPLADGDPDVKLDVQAVLEKGYEAGDYDSVINYDSPCRPPLSAEDQEWANQLIQTARNAP